MTHKIVIAHKCGHLQVFYAKGKLQPYRQYVGKLTRLYCGNCIRAINNIYR